MNGRGRSWRPTFVPDRGGESDSPPLSARAWRASVVGLHLAFALIVAVAVLTVVTDHSAGTAGSPGRTATFWSLGALGVLLLAYLTLGAPAMAGLAERRAVAYLVVLVVVLGIVAAATPDVLFVLFIAYPQVWFLVEDARPGVTWTFLLAASSAVGSVVHFRTVGGSSVDAISSAVVGLLFSLLLGIWISRVLEQSRGRAELIAELERTRGDLASAHHEQGVMAERERLAREVHDTLAQGWTSVVVLAQTASAELDRSPERTRERLALIEEVARDNLTQTRAIVAAFAPTELDGSTLVEALRRLAERFSRETGVATHVDVQALVGELGVLPLRRSQEVVLLRASQEALSNARRHAHASAVTVRLRRDGDDVGVTVVDDGDGFDPESAVGTGLRGLRQRLEQAGGVLEVTSERGRGTTVAAHLPGKALR